MTFEYCETCQSEVFEDEIDTINGVSYCPYCDNVFNPIEDYEEGDIIDIENLSFEDMDRAAMAQINPEFETLETQIIEDLTESEMYYDLEGEIY